MKAESQAIFLTSELPFPPTGGGKLRDAQVLSLLAEKLEVEILCFAAPGKPVTGGAGPCKATLIERDRAPLWKRAVYPLRPYVVNGYSRRMDAALRERARPGKLLWVSRLAMAQYIPLARRLGYRIILDEHNVESDLLLEAALSSPRKWPSTLLAAQCAYYEGRFCGASNAVVATSDSDAAKLRRLAPNIDIHVIPNSVDCPSYEAARSASGTTLLFPGTLSYGPNVEGLLWFAAEVMPRLKAALGDGLPGVVAAGANPSEELSRTLEAKGIRVLANPDSMRSLLREAAIVFVPLKSGSGTRLKILEAMASGRPVVSTGKGAEGLVLTPTYDVFIADQPDAFTTAIVRLIRDPALRTRIGEQAIRTVESRYDWRCARPLLDKLLSATRPG